MVLPGDRNYGRAEFTRDVSRSVGRAVSPTTIWLTTPDTLCRQWPSVNASFLTIIDRPSVGIRPHQLLMRGVIRYVIEQLPRQDKHDLKSR